MGVMVRRVMVKPTSYGKQAVVMTIYHDHCDEHSRVTFIMYFPPTAYSLPL